MGVTPTDSEEVHSGADCVLDKAAPRCQVQEVILADHRRNQQQRALTHLGGAGAIFNQLEHFVAVHHRARGHGHVLAHLETFAVYLRRHATVMPQIAEPVFCPAHDAAAARVEGLLQGRRIAQQAIGGCDGAG
ncbi:hypothetical protein D3C85_997220 [compost metagenome]